MKKLFVLGFLFICATIVLGQGRTKTLIINPNSKKHKADTTHAEFSNYAAFDFLARYTPKDYTKLLDSLIKYKKTNFYKLRMSYTVTPEYNPLDTVEKGMFGEIDRLVAVRKYTVASAVADSILKRNFLSLNGHLILSNLLGQMRDSVRSDYHSDLFDSLATSIRITGNGQDPKSAFIVISTEEEVPFLTAIGLRAQSRKTAELEGHHFAIYDVKSRFGKDQLFIYFNIDIPYAYELKHAKKSK